MQIAMAGDLFVPHNSPTTPAMGQGLIQLLGKCDAVVVNFEAPVDLGSAAVPAFKTGPNLRQHPKTLRYLVEAGVNAVSLANNHTADFGEAALRQTAEMAKSAGLQIAGLVHDGEVGFAEWRVGGLVVRLLAFAEEEWCGDPEDRIRVAVLDLAQAAQAVAQVKRGADAVIVALHGNNEHSPLPNPGFLHQARLLVECGADAVVVHHSHRISGVETHIGKPILYGLGNFQFCTPAFNAHWHQGLLAVLDVARNGDAVTVTHRLYPVETDPNDYSVDLAAPEQTEKLLNDVASLSQIIASPASLTAHFDKFVVENDEMYVDFLNSFARGSRLARMIGRIFVRRVFLRRRRHAMLLNGLRCHAHRMALTHTLVRHLDRQ